MNDLRAIERINELEERIEQLEEEKQELQKALDVATELWAQARREAEQ